MGNPHAQFRNAGESSAERNATQRADVGGRGSGVQTNPATGADGDGANGPVRDASGAADTSGAVILPDSTPEPYVPTRLKAGDVLSERFVIERLAGSGGMGAVYRALDRITGEAVALKVARRGPHEERFAREARVLAELVHPAIVRYE